MEPYVIRQGDYVLKVATAFDFDPDAVWNDPSNDDLRKLRQNPNILLAGDLLHIPDQTSTPPVVHDLAVGTTNSFVSPPAPTVTLMHKFVGADASTYASRAYTVEELDELTGLQTDGDGVVTFDVPVTLDTATVVFTDTGESWALAIGTLDPIDTAIGVFERLQNLGHIDGDVEYDEENLEVIRAGLRSLKGAQADSDQAAPDSSASGDGPPSSAPASSADSASSADDGATDDDADSDDSDDADSDDSDDADSGDDAGLADDGTLDADTRSLLLSVYGF